MNLIIIAGIKRSFSTGQYNIVRIALEKAGYNVIIKGHRFNTGILDDLGEKDVVILKRHPFHEEYAEKADHIFLTDRPDEEIIESLTKFNGIRPGQSHIDNMRRHLEKWREYPSYVFNYAHWKYEPEEYTDQLVFLLGLKDKVDSGAVLEAFNEIEPPESGQDPKSLLFHNHITSK